MSNIDPPSSNNSSNNTSLPTAADDPTSVLILYTQRAVPNTNITANETPYVFPENDSDRIVIRMDAKEIEKIVPASDGKRIYGFQLKRGYRLEYNGICNNEKVQHVYEYPNDSELKTPYLDVADWNPCGWEGVVLNANQLKVRKINPVDCILSESQTALNEKIDAVRIAMGDLRRITSLDLVIKSSAKHAYWALLILLGAISYVFFHVSYKYNPYRTTLISGLIAIFLAIIITSYGWVASAVYL